MLTRPILSASVLAAIVALATACDDNLPVDETVDAAPPGDSGPQAVTIDFAARIDGGAFACGQTYEGIGVAGSPYVASDFRFYVHDVRLIGADGAVPVALDANEWQTEGGIALLDFEDATANCQMGSTATHTALTGTVPAGMYSGIAFKVGVPFDRNHLDATTAEAPLNVPAMYWAWSSGYKFMKTDGVVNGLGFNLHVGSTGCGTTGATPPESPCASPNVLEVAVDGYIPGTHTIVADLAPIIAEVDVSVNTMATPPGCMSFPGDPECETIFPKLGLPYGDRPADTQRLFSAE